TWQKGEYHFEPPKSLHPGIIRPYSKLVFGNQTSAGMTMSQQEKCLQELIRKTKIKCPEDASISFSLYPSRFPEGMLSTPTEVSCDGKTYEVAHELNTAHKNCRILYAGGKLHIADDEPVVSGQHRVSYNLHKFIDTPLIMEAFGETLMNSLFADLQKKQVSL